jgi:acetyl-CoA carboxylase beta subunit
MEHKMQMTEKIEAENLIKKLPDDSTFEDIQYHIYIAEKLKKARQQISEGKVSTQKEAEKRLDKWIIK